MEGDGGGGEDIENTVDVGEHFENTVNVGEPIDFVCRGAFREHLGGREEY